MSINSIDTGLVCATSAILCLTECHIGALDPKTRARIPKFALLGGGTFCFFFHFFKAHCSQSCTVRAARLRFRVLCYEYNGFPQTNKAIPIFSILGQTLKIAKKAHAFGHFEPQALSPKFGFQAVFGGSSPNLLPVASMQGLCVPLVRPSAQLIAR
jgi:hypothetical protein